MMSLSSLQLIEELIACFNNKQGKITIISRVVKHETFGDDYHDFDLRELLQNKELMEQIAMMEQEESKQNAQSIPISKSYLPSENESDLIRQNLSEMKDIEVLDNSSITNFEAQFEIDRFKFSIQFMIFPKSFIHCWIGYVGSSSSHSVGNSRNQQVMTMSHSGGIGGQQMGGPIASMNNGQPPTEVIKEHFLSNLVISIPHRKPLSDEFGVSRMSTMTLINDSMEIGNDANGRSQGMNEENQFRLSANDLATKLSKMMSKVSKSTVQMSCDIPSQIINASISKPSFHGMRRRMDEMNHRMEKSHMSIQIEQKVMELYRNIPNQSTVI